MGWLPVHARCKWSSFEYCAFTSKTAICLDFLMFSKPKDNINFAQKRGLVYRMFSQDCNVVYVDETGHDVRTRKWNHVDVIKIFNIRKSALS